MIPVAEAEASYVAGFPVPLPLPPGQKLLLLVSLTKLIMLFVARILA